MSITFDVKLRTPFTLVLDFLMLSLLLIALIKTVFKSVSGASSTGKSTLVAKILRQQDYVLDRSFDTITYCYGIETELLRQLVEEFPHMKTIVGFPENEFETMENFDPKLHHCLIIGEKYIKYNYYYLYSIIGCCFLCVKTIY